MNIRSIKRQMAKSRATVAGIKGVNKGFANKDETGRPNWKKFVDGASGKRAAELQAIEGLKARRKAETDRRLKARKIRKIRKVG